MFGCAVVVGGGRKNGARHELTRTDGRRRRTPRDSNRSNSRSRGALDAGIYGRRVNGNRRRAYLGAKVRSPAAHQKTDDGGCGQSDLGPSGPLTITASCSTVSVGTPTLHTGPHPSSLLTRLRTPSPHPISRGRQPAGQQPPLWHLLAYVVRCLYQLLIAQFMPHEHLLPHPLPTTDDCCSRNEPVSPRCFLPALSCSDKCTSGLVLDCQQQLVITFALIDSSITVLCNEWHQLQVV